MRSSTIKLFLALALALTALVYSFNRANICARSGDVCNMAAAPDEVIEKTLRLHTLRPPFSNRLFFSTLLRTLHEDVGLAPAVAYDLAQYGLLFVSLVMAGVYASSLFGRDTGKALASVVLLAVSFQVLFLDYYPMYTWDDVSFFVFALGALTAARNQHLMLASVLVTLGSLCRETILFYVPLIVLTSRAIWPRRLVAVAVPVAFYLLYTWSRGGSGASGAFHEHLAYNFNSFGRSVESLSYVWLGSGPMMIAASFYGVELWRRRSKLDDLERFFLIGFLTVVPAFLGGNMLLGRLREIRIAFPLAFITVPMVVHWWSTRGWDRLGLRSLAVAGGVASLAGVAVLVAAGSGVVRYKAAPLTLAYAVAQLAVAVGLVVWGTLRDQARSRVPGVELTN